MCGICGIVNFKSDPVSERNIRSMMSKLKHRGPDDNGVFLENNIGLGHLRLSIIDLSTDGHQPMFSEDNRFVISFNGEIYNFIELKKELSSKFSFCTKTDTEVLINAYRYWGKNCLDHFNGMFAFAMFDRKEKILFIARDRFGIKPFQRSVAEKLPKSIIKRPKHGFSSPIDRWLRHDLKDFAQDVLSRDKIKKQGIFQEDRID